METNYIDYQQALNNIIHHINRGEELKNDSIWLMQELVNETKEDNERE